MRKLRVGDKVQVMRGKDAGKTGELKKFVIKEYKGEEVVKVVVEGVNVVKRSRKPNPALGITGGIEQYEKPIDISNVMYLENNKPVRVGFKVDEKTGKKVRVSKKTGKAID